MATKFPYTKVNKVPFFRNGFVLFYGASTSAINADHDYGVSMLYICLYWGGSIFFRKITYDFWILRVTSRIFRLGTIGLSRNFCF